MGPSHFLADNSAVYLLGPKTEFYLSLHNLSEKNPMLDLKLTFSFRNLFSSKKEQLESDKAFRLNVRSIYLFRAVVAVVAFWMPAFTLFYHWDEIIMLTKYFVTFKRKRQAKCSYLNHYFRFTFYYWIERITVHTSPTLQVYEWAE